MWYACSSFSPARVGLVYYRVITVATTFDHTLLSYVTWLSRSYAFTSLLIRHATISWGKSVFVQWKSVSIRIIHICINVSRKRSRDSYHDAVFANKIATLCNTNRHPAAKKKNRSFTSRGAIDGLGLRLWLTSSIVLHRRRRNLPFSGNLEEKASCVDDKTVLFRYTLDTDWIRTIRTRWHVCLILSIHLIWDRPLFFFQVFPCLAPLLWCFHGHIAVCVRTNWVAVWQHELQFALLLLSYETPPSLLIIMIVQTKHMDGSTERVKNGIRS